MPSRFGTSPKPIVKETFNAASPPALPRQDIVQNKLHMVLASHHSHLQRPDLDMPGKCSSLPRHYAQAEFGSRKRMDNYNEPHAFKLSWPVLACQYEQPRDASPPIILTRLSPLPSLVGRRQAVFVPFHAVLASHLVGLSYNIRIL
jgi:hypothetical protein